MSKHFLAAAFVALVASPALAGEHCQHCGCCQDVVAVCRPSCDKKEVTETVYEVVCEDFCVPGCSHARKCETDCGECVTVWEPSCGRVRTRQKLVKKEIKHFVPVTKCTVVYLCPKCCGECGCADAGSAAGTAPVAASPVTKPRSTFWTALTGRPFFGR